MSAERDAVIHRWMHAKQAAKQWAEEERRLRDFIAQQFGYRPDTPAFSIPYGAHEMQLGNGYALKLVTAETVALKDGAEFDKFLTYVRNPSLSGGRSIEDAMVTWKPVLDKRGFDAMRTTNPDAYRMLVPAIERKPKAPTLDLETP